MSNTLPNRLRQAAQYTGLDSMRELLIEAAGALESAPQPQERKPLTDEQIRKWWVSENGLEDCRMSKLDDFAQVVRAIEAAHGIKD